ncbi:MAG: Hsp20/alpha crystallin family protein [Bacteroidota bacterium]|jgi:HSP20 family protein
MLVRFQPVTTLFDEIDSIINSPITRYPAYRQTNRFADVAMKENGEEVQIFVQLPGIAKDDVKIGLHDTELTITAERKQPELKENEQWIRNEIRYGKFERTIDLPYAVDADNVSATHENGLLRITLPKHEIAKPKQISIR